MLIDLYSFHFAEVPPDLCYPNLYVAIFTTISVFVNCKVLFQPIDIPPLFIIIFTDGTNSPGVFEL